MIFSWATSDQGQQLVWDVSRMGVNRSCAGVGPNDRSSRDRDRLGGLSEFVFDTRIEFQTSVLTCEAVASLV